MWFFHLHNDHPTFYETVPSFSLQTLLHDHHPLDHFLNGALIHSMNIQGDQLFFSLTTKGHGACLFTITLRRSKPRYHLENEQGVLHQSHADKVLLDLDKNIVIENSEPLFQTALVTELMQPFKKIVLQQLKLKTNKIKQYDLDEQKANQSTVYQQLADTLLLDQKIDARKLSSLFGSLLDYDHLSFGECLNACYKKIKKAKIALLEIQKQRQENHQQLEMLFTWQEWIQHPSLENYTNLTNALIQKRFLVQSVKKITEVKAISPYQIQYKKWVISFGKNQKQNDYLTFQLAKKNHYFFHLDGYPSHHVILHLAHFDVDAIRFASEFLLFLNQREDGSVVYAKVGSLKQTTVLGQVKIRDQKTIFVKQSHAYPFPTLLSSAIRI